MTGFSLDPLPLRCCCFSLLFLWLTAPVQAQPDTLDKSAHPKTRAEEVRLGSSTAKGGFENEDQIREKFNAWESDPEARLWLQTMGYPLGQIEQVMASKPHGEKADVEVRITTASGEHVEGVSIKLVSNPQGFNQIDKRWLKTYAQMWRMPEEVHAALQLFVGEVPPTRKGRDARRMFLDELSESQQRAVVHFFSTHREEIVSDLFAGDGAHAAGWMMVTLKPSANASPSERAGESVAAVQGSRGAESVVKDQPRWELCSTADAVAYFSAGDVLITPAGSLKIGRVTMQRKGGDNGRPSANMLQFKINPTLLFQRKS